MAVQLAVLASPHHSTIRYVAVRLGNPLQRNPEVHQNWMRVFRLVVETSPCAFVTRNMSHGRPAAYLTPRGLARLRLPFGQGAQGKPLGHKIARMVG